MIGKTFCRVHLDQNQSLSQETEYNPCNPKYFPVEGIEDQKQIVKDFVNGIFERVVSSAEKHETYDDEEN